MKTKTSILSVILLITISLFVFDSCNEKESSNPTPTPSCSISSPHNGEEILLGEMLTISVSAAIADGTIAEVQFYVDNVKIASVDSPPYTYIWDTKDESVGTHTLKATCFDNNDQQVSDEISIIVIEELSKFTDPRDGQEYITIEIGDQTWFAQNLNYETNDSWWYENSAANGDLYGRLYTWNAAQNACPEGWSLPTDNEWKILEKHLGMSQTVVDEEGWRGTDEGGKMKSTNGWNLEGNGTNSSRFNALPGGFKGTSFFSLGNNGNWWTSSESSSSSGFDRGLDAESTKVRRDGISKLLGSSVRCIEN